MAADTDEAPITKDTPVDRSVQNKTPTKKSAPKTASKTPRKSGVGTIHAAKTSRDFINGRVANPERIIALELILAETIYVAITLYEGKAPTPKVMAALLAVYGILALFTIAGGEWGRVAYLFGGLVLVAITFNKEVSSVITKIGGVTAPSTPVNTTAAQQTVQTLLQTAALG